MPTKKDQKISAIKIKKNDDAIGGFIDGKPFYKPKPNNFKFEINKTNKEYQEKKFSFFFGLFICFIIEVVLLCIGFLIYFLITK